MALRIRWTPEAEYSFEEIIRYIEFKWSQKEVGAFVSKVSQIIDSISLYPYQSKKSSSFEIRIAVIGKHNSLIYRVNESDNTVELLYFWSHKMNPKKNRF